MLRIVTALAAALACGAAIASELSPYAGEETRDIKALSAERLSGLLDGAGLGYAKAAELNGWPGPRHVLDLRERLELSAEQHKQMQTAFNDMQTAARALGQKLVHAEAELDQLFQQQSPTPNRISQLTAQIAGIEGELRAVHLAAHLRATGILSKHQRHEYVKARGYTSGSGHGGHKHGH